MTDPALTRRRALAGAAVGGLSLPLLAACGGGGSSSATAQDPAPPVERRQDNDGGKSQDPAVTPSSRPRTSPSGAV